MTTAIINSILGIHFLILLLSLSFVSLFDFLSYLPLTESKSLKSSQRKINKLPSSKHSLDLRGYLFIYCFVSSNKLLSCPIPFRMSSSTYKTADISCSGPDKCFSGSSIQSPAFIAIINPSWTNSPSTL